MVVLHLARPPLGQASACAFYALTTEMIDGYTVNQHLKRHDTSLLQTLIFFIFNPELYSFNS